MPFYLVCDVSGAAKKHLYDINQSIRGLCADITKEPVVHDAARICVISFAESAKTIVPMTSVSGSEMPTLESIGEGANYGAAFRFIADTVMKDLGEMKDLGTAVYRPCVFFITASPPIDRNWAATFKRTLTADSHRREGVKHHPIFVPVRLGDAPETMIRKLTYPPSRSREASAQGTLPEVLGVIMNSVISYSIQPDTILNYDPDYVWE
jgi:uncharacterized protein YegL